MSKTNKNYDPAFKFGATTLGSYNVITVDTSGTTSVDVFGSNGAPIDSTITAVYLISKDTTAGNITLDVGGSTVATIAKGTTAGALVGASSLSNTTVSEDDAVTVVSSSAGDATVMIHFTA